MNGRHQYVSNHLSNYFYYQLPEIKMLRIQCALYLGCCAEVTYLYYIVALKLLFYGDTVARLNLNEV